MRSWRSRQTRSILLSTKTASRIIADVYAVRKDYFDANRVQVHKFVHAVLRSQEALTELLANKSSQQAKYRQILAKSADLLLGAPQATADVEILRRYYGSLKDEDKIEVKIAGQSAR